MSKKFYITEERLVSFLKKNIFEEISKKEQFARGMEHIIYPMKSDPTKLIKVGKTSDVAEWSVIFENNPDLFPKVYKFGVMKDKKGMAYAIVERMDTKKFENNWNDLQNDLELLGVIDQDENQSLTDVYMELAIKSDLSELDDIGNKLHENNMDSAGFYDKLKDLIFRADEAIGGVMDVHKYNFGYDNDGNIKFIDI